MPAPIDRRVFLKRMAAVGAGAAAGAAASFPSAHASPASRPAQGGRTLTLICWEGYADPSFVKPFEKMYNCTVSATYAGSSDEMVAKWIAGHGNTYDLVSASGDATRRFINSRTLETIDVSKLNNFEQLFPKFYMPAWNTRAGVRYGVSFTWGPDVSDLRHACLQAGAGFLGSDLRPEVQGQALHRRQPDHHRRCGALSGDQGLLQPEQRAIGEDQEHLDRPETAAAQVLGRQRAIWRMPSVTARWSPPMPGP